METIILTIGAIIAVFYFGFVVGEAFTAYRLRRALRIVAETLNMDFDEELQKIKNENGQSLQVSKLYQLETETHGDMIYLFDKERKDFICQAKTLEELAKLAKEHRKILGAVVTHGDKTLVFSDGKYQEYETQ